MSINSKPTSLIPRALNNQALKLDLKNEIKQNLTSQSDTNKSLWKTWQIALAIGIPSAIIIGYFLYKRNRNNKPQVKSSKVVVVESTSKNNNDPPKSDTSAAKNDSSNDIKKIEAKQIKKTPLDEAIDYKNEGNKYFQQKKYKEALDCYSKAIELCPKSDKDELPKFYQNRAAAYENLKMFDKVIEDCDMALELDPRYTKALLRRAKAAELTENHQMAFEDVTALCILENFANEKNIVFADKLVKTLGEKMCKEKLKNRKSIAISKHFVNNFYIGLMNDPIYKNENLLNELKSYENEEEAKDILNAIQEFNNGDYDKCIEYCTKDIENPANIDSNVHQKYINELLNLRGSLYMLKCQFNDAIKDFNRLLSNDSASKQLKSNTLIKMTALNLQRNEEDEAFVNYEKAIQIDPTNEDIYCNRAQVYAMKGVYEESFKDFDKSIELNPDHKIARLQKAFFQFRKLNGEILSSEFKFNSNFNPDQELSPATRKRLDDEIKKLEPLLEKYSDVPEAYSLFAQILSEQKNYEKAEKYYKLALEKDSTNAALLVQRALNYMQWHNEFDTPINMLNDAINIDDTCEFAYETLASIEIQRGNLLRAAELFEKAINLTRNEESMLNLCSMLIGAQTQHKIVSKIALTGFR